MSATKKPADKHSTLTREMVVINKLGIHARPAAMFVKTANRFGCDVFVEKDGEKVNGKSIMGLMMLAAGPGSRGSYRAGAWGARMPVSYSSTAVITPARGTVTSTGAGGAGNLAESMGSPTSR